MAESSYEDAVRELPEESDNRPLALIGFMGIGKSTVGAELSRRLQWPLTDTDSAIEARSNKTIREIFDWLGEAHFRELEHNVIAEQAAAGKRILSLGGGAFIQDGNRALLLERCIVVYLAAPWTYVSRSIQRLKNTRPLLRGRSTAELQQLFDSRHPIYDLAHIRVAVPGRNPSQVAGRILELVGRT